MHRRLTFLLGVFLVAVFHFGLGSAAWGQGGATGAISGQVIDSSGSSIAGAEVQIMNASTETLVRKVPASSEGTIFAALLTPSYYDVAANKPSFTETNSSGI